MFDIHCHLIFGVDDGPDSIEASLQLAEASIAEGVTHIVSTPHANDRYRFDPDASREKLALLQQHLGDRLKLGLGCDFHLSYANLEDLPNNPSRYTINGSQYLLVELPDYGISPRLSDVFFEMILSGIVPIITHPERNFTLLEDPHRLVDWIRSGCLVQITAASLMGRFGKKPQAMAHDIIRKNWVHFVASDAHSMKWRPPCVAGAHELLRKRYGQEVADRLCIHNPGAAFFGKPMPPQPPVIDRDNNFENRWRRLLQRFSGG